VDVLVNTAGTMDLATIAESDDRLFDRTVATNLKGTFNALREAARRLRDGGRIVNFSSSVTALLQPTYGVYAATKAAVEAMTTVLAKEMRGRGITVNAVAPGPVATKLFLDGKPQEAVDAMAKAAPLGAWASRTTSPPRSPSSPGRTAPGSTARPCAPTAGSSDPRRAPPTRQDLPTGDPTMPNHVILVTGASSGFGLMTARALAEAGHTVYGSMRDTAGRNAPRVAEAAAWAAERGADLRAVELDVQSDASADAGVARVLQEAGRLDAVVHNAGHMVFGPAEAFTPDQFVRQYDVNVLGAQRVNRAALPHMRKRAADCWSGWVPPRRAAARRPSSGRTSRPRRRWTPSRSPTRPSWPAGAWKARSWCRALSPRAPTTSPTPASRPTRRGRRSTTPDPMPASPTGR
jgi:NAD(P)-dependent dehydrogenase (short-subunit alcohol dehydrogenase family)